MKLSSITFNCTPIKFSAENTRKELLTTQKTASDEYNAVKQDIRNANSIARKSDLPQENTDAFVKNEERRELDKNFQEKKANLNAINSKLRNGDLTEIETVETKESN